MDRSNLKVHTGWRQEWTYPKRMGKNGYIDIQEIVRGPFSSPRLLQAQPFVTVSSSQRETRNLAKYCNNIRRGIPDTWREYLAVKGLCGRTETFTLKKNFISCCVRCHATDRLWNGMGLPLVQGIPDPWKNRSIQQMPSAECTRQRCTRGKNFSTQVSYIYDGDDEAEIERSARCQFNKDRIDNKKDATQVEQAEINFPLNRREVRKMCREEWEDIKKDDRKKRKKRAGKEYKNSVVSINRETVIKENVRKHASTNSVRRKREKLADNKCRCGKSIERPVQKDVETVAMERTNEAVRATILFKDKADQVQGSCDKKDIDVCTESVPKIFCYNCLLRNSMISNTIQYCTSNFARPTHEVNLSNIVLCKECENLYRSCRPQNICSKPKCIRYTSNTTRCSKRKKISRSMKFKLCDYMRKARKRFTTRKYSPRRRIETRSTIFAKKELKLMCYRCSSPYLKIASIHANGIARKGSLCNCKTPPNRLKKERIRVGDHVAKHSIAAGRRNIARCSKKSDCTCVENKRHVSTCDPERLSQSIYIKRKNSGAEKSHRVLKEKTENGVKRNAQKVVKSSAELRKNIRNETRTTIYGDSGNKELNKLKGNIVQCGVPFIDCKGRGIKCTKDAADDCCSSNTQENKESDNKYDDSTSYFKLDVAEFSGLKCDKRKLHSVSDSGNYADVSESILNVGFNVAAPDELLVTSDTFIQHLNDAIRTKNILCQAKKLKKSRRISRRLSADNAMKQSLEKMGDHVIQKNRDINPNKVCNSCCYTNRKKGKNDTMAEKLISACQSARNEKALKYEGDGVEKYGHRKYVIPF